VPKNKHVDVEKETGMGGGESKDKTKEGSICTFSPITLLPYGERWYDSDTINEII
jgi:hypothetical protein